MADEQQSTAATNGPAGPMRVALAELHLRAGDFRREAYGEHPVALGADIMLRSALKGAEDALTSGWEQTEDEILERELAAILAELARRGTATESGAYATDGYYIRCKAAQAAAPEWGPLAGDHPLVGLRCLACHEPFVEGHCGWLLPLGPGGDAEARAKCLAGGWYNAVAIPVHSACMVGVDRRWERSNHGV